MKNLYSRILEPKIINDRFEGKHAIINMPDMRTMLECIYENKLFFERVGTKGSSRHEWTYGKHISGRENLKRALEMGRTSDAVINLYKKLRNKVESRVDISKFTGQGLSCKRKRVVRDDGDDLSMSRLMGGNDQYWNTTLRKSKRANVRIGMNIAISHLHNEKDFARLGAILALTSDMLTKMGYAVEVIAYQFGGYASNGTYDWKYLGISIPIKKPNEPLDIHRLMSAGLSGLFRDFIFGLKDIEYKSNSSLGYQAETTDTYKRELNLLHVVEQKFCSSDEKAVDGLAQAMQNIAERPKWFGNR
tara:strand:- start:303 stop:1214 length:912 start_codon:yes stop_codon:yes gene_type:complete